MARRLISDPLPYTCISCLASRATNLSCGYNYKDHLWQYYHVKFEANQQCHITFIKPKFTSPPMLAKTLFQLVVFIHVIQSQSQDRISRQAFSEASQSRYEFGDTSSWYHIVVSWLLANGLDINNLPPLKQPRDW